MLNQNLDINSFNLKMTKNIETLNKKIFYFNLNTNFKNQNKLER